MTDSDKPKIKITPKEEAKKPQEKPNKHIVTEGDSLSAIAVKYRLNMDDLKEWNHLTSDNALLGTTLRLSAPELSKMPGRDTWLETRLLTKDQSLNFLMQTHKKPSLISRELLRSLIIFKKIKNPDFQSEQ